MKKSFLLITIIFFICQSTKAQQVQKGFGTSNSTFLFGFTSYAAKSQCMFWPSDFTNLAQGDITRIYYKYGSGAGDQVLTRFSIEMGQTTETAYNGNAFFTGLSPVFYRDSYTIPQGVSGNWFYIDLDTPFTYDSTKTLIVQLIFPESAIDSWGTLGSTNTPTKKIISPDTLATIGDGSSGTWQDFGFDLATPQGIKSFTSNNNIDFVLTPNPANSFYQIKLFNAVQHNYQLSILNLLGEIVEHESLNTNNQTLNINHLSNGVYFVKVSDVNGKEIIKKLVVEK
ncbi:MAG TPA: T9SS type A sorting domain-containing protein [Bacteroidia bacterium]|nr:T9SS type A sorting domain-containing protein [Bacteroidia bacterium]